MRILLAGATGTAGTALLDALVAAGRTVIALSRAQAPHNDIALWLPWSAVTGAGHPALAGIDAVVSCLASRTGGIRDSRQGAGQSRVGGVGPTDQPARRPRP